MEMHVDQSSVETARTLPDRIADELIARIFTGELAPGETLAAERSLAAELGVDRTSLRAALRQLTRMKLLRAVRGSGITVLDYRRHAGLDFLAAVLEVPGLELGGAFLLEALDHWNAVMPQVTARALSRATPDTLRALDGLLSEQLAAFDAGDARGVVVELELQLQDLIIEQTGDLTLRLMANATRELRRKLTELQYQLVDARAQVRTQRAQLATVLRRGAGSQRQIRAHAADLQAKHAQLRAHLQTLPPGPTRNTRWQAPARTRSKIAHATA